MVSKTDKAVLFHWGDEESSQVDLYEFKEVCEGRGRLCVNLGGKLRDH